MPAAFDVRDMPPLMHYINRIGAHIANFRRFIIRVQTERHYYIETAIITMAADGTITAPEAYRPTDAEQNAIIGAVSTAAIPRSIAASEATVELLRRQLGNDAVLWPCYTRGAPEHSCITMVQQRVQTPDGKKYLPWSYWSDEHWRPMEPGGKLPFWKPKEPTGYHKYIMVHEGAKSASFAHELTTNPNRVDELMRHPWGAILSTFEHWGALGGARAVNRCNFQEIKDIKPMDVVYFCDADWEGLCALKLFTKEYDAKLKAIMLGDDWPIGWDIADPMPANMFSDESRWLGQPLMKMCGPATWATSRDQITEDGKKKWVTSIRDSFAKEWVHIIVPEVYVHRYDRQNVLLDEKGFNHLARPFSHVENTATLLKRVQANQIDTLRYDPSKEAGIYRDGETGLRYFNTHIPSSIQPEQGSPGPFEDFLEHLIPNQRDRNNLKKWCATLIARPDIKMHYSVLLISETQGVGKSTLGEKILMPLVGVENTSIPGERDITADFNYWCSHKRLAIFHEVYQGHNAKTTNLLKSIVTDDVLTINKKNQHVYQIDNWIHIFACSNSKRALQLSSDDRRWFVPKVTEKKKNTTYWLEFNKWLKEQGGLGIIKQWAIDYVRVNNPVMKGEDAPWGSGKKEVIEEGYSEGQELISQFLNLVWAGIKENRWPDNVPDNIKMVYSNGRLPFILDIALIQLIRARVYNGRQSERLERPLAVHKVAKDQGWFVSAERARVVAWGSRSSSARLIATEEMTASITAGELADTGERPLDVPTWADALIPPSL